MDKDNAKRALIGFTEFAKGITGNNDLKIPEDIAKEYGIYEPTRYYVRVKFSYKFFNGIPVKTDRLYRTYKDVVVGPVPGCVEGMICIIDINGTSHEWNKEAIDEIKVYPQLEKVKEEDKG